MYRKRARDEEEQLLVQRALLLQHKQELELQQAMYGPANRPSHLPIQIQNLEDEIRRLDRRVTYARHKKQLKATMQQVATTSRFVTEAVLPGPSRRRRGMQRSHAPSVVGILAIVVFIVGIVTGVGRLRPSLSGDFGQAEAAQLSGEMIPVPTPALLPTMAPIQETAMSIGAWPPPDAERRVVGATGGIGVNLRVDPYQESPGFIAIPDGTPVYLLSKSIDNTGAIWWWVVLGDGAVGHINERYLLVP